MDGFYIASADFPENPNVARERAQTLNAQQSKSGVIVETVSEMKNGNLTRDEIRTISAVILKIHSESMTVEI